MQEQSRGNLNDQPTTLSVDEQQSEAIVKTVRSIAEKSNDSKLLAKLESTQSIAYHSICLSSYQISQKRKYEEELESRYWHKNRQFHQLAFNAISEIIKAEIIENNPVMYLSVLLSQISLCYWNLLKVK